MAPVQCHVFPLGNAMVKCESCEGAFSSHVVAAIFKYLTFFDSHLSVSRGITSEGMISSMSSGGRGSVN